MGGSKVGVGSFCSLQLMARAASVTQQVASGVGAETMAPMRGACLRRVWRVDPDAPARWAERRARHVRADELYVMSCPLL